MEIASIVFDVVTCLVVGFAAYKHKKYRESEGDAKVRKAMEIARVAVKSAGSDVQRCMAIFRLFDYAEDGKYDWTDKQVGEFLAVARSEQNGA